MTILQLKEQILKNWSCLVTNLEKEKQLLVTTAQDNSNSAILMLDKVIKNGVPPSVNHIRLRDGKNAQASGPLRNDRILSRCLLGLFDGRKIIIQILPEAEVIGPDDLILSLRIASYEKKTLTRVIDFPVSRNCTVLSLFETLVSRYPHLNE